MTSDCHIHVFPDYTAEQHLEIARAAGVSRTVIIQPGGSGGALRARRAWVSDSCAEGTAVGGLDGDAAAVDDCGAEEDGGVPAD